jgi:hypothetical protein
VIPYTDRFLTLSNRELATALRSHDQTSSQSQPSGYQYEEARSI